MLIATSYIQQKPTLTVISNHFHGTTVPGGKFIFFSAERDIFTFIYMMFNASVSSEERMSG